MTLLAVPQVIIRFGGGAVIQPSFTLGDTLEGVLGTNVLGAFEYANVPNVQRVSVRRGRNSLDDDFGAGGCVVEFYDTTGDWNPNNPNGAYVGLLKPGIQLQLRVVRNGVARDVFAGYVRAFDHQFVIGEPWARVTITAEDALYLFNLAEIVTVPGATAGDLPGERINLILDEMNWSSSSRVIADGTTTLQPDPAESRSVLEAIRQCEQSDLGMFYVDTRGRPTFLSRVETVQKAVGAGYRFTDAGQDIRFNGVDFTYNDEDVINSCTVTRLGGTPQTVTNTASVNEFFNRQLTRNDLLMQTDDRALQQANAIVAYRRTPKVRLNAIQFEVLDVDAYDAATQGDFGDRIDVDKSYPNSNFQLPATVQGIDHEITVSTWTTTFTVAEALAYAFVLGDNSFGVLDVNVV